MLELDYAQDMEDIEMLLSPRQYLFKYYYRLTVWLPRPLPKTIEEINQIQYIMQEYLGLDKGLDVWYTVLSQMTSGAPTSLYKSYASMLNAGKKLRIGQMVQEQKSIAHKAHMDMLEGKLKEATLRVASELKQEEITGSHQDHADWTHSIAKDLQQRPPDIQNEMPELPGSQARVVSTSGVQRF